MLQKITAAAVVVVCRHDGEAKIVWMGTSVATRSGGQQLVLYISLPRLVSYPYLPPPTPSRRGHSIFATRVSSSWTAQDNTVLFCHSLPSPLAERGLTTSSPKPQHQVTKTAKETNSTTGMLECPDNDDRPLQKPLRHQ